MANTPTPRDFTGRDVLVGRIFNNRFRIQTLLARGGMGKVYRATQVPLGRQVALKVLNPSYTAEPLPDFHRRFFLEAAIAARLTHPNTVTVFDYGKSDDDIYYIAMELLDGVPLRTALARARSMPPRRALHIATQVGRALHEAHALGAVHRDLKPANIFLLQRGDTQDFVKVLDFGLVKHMTQTGTRITQPGKFLGSPGYMAPEQIRGNQPVDWRCDIYALGVLLYEMLTGTPPFVRTNAIETMMAHVHDAVPPMRSVNPGLRLPPRLEQVVHRCLEKDPSRRYDSMTSLLDALLELTGGLLDLTHDTQVSPMRRMPERLDDEEKSGWTVVSTTGVLAIPKRPEPLPTPTQAMETQLMTAAAPSHPPPAAAQRPSGAGPAAPVAPVAVKKTGVTLVLSLLFLVGAPQIDVWGKRLADGWRARGHDQPAEFVLRLASEPAGARVLLGETVLCEQTPCVVRWAGDEARLGRLLSLHFVHPGFDEYVASRVIDGPTLTVRAHLCGGALP